MLKTKMRAIVYIGINGYEARCIDASGVGYGDTASDAIRDLESVMAMNFMVANDMSLPLERAATAEEEALWAQVAAGKEVPDYVDCAVYMQVTAGKPEGPRRFEAIVN